MSSASGDLLPVTTGIGVDAIIPVKKRSVSADAPEQRQAQSSSSQKKSTTLNSRVLSADDDLLMEAFDNDIDESENDDTKRTITAFSQATPQQSSSPSSGVNKPPAGEERQHPSHQLRSDQIAAQETALYNINQAYNRLHQQMVKWREQAVLSGRAALQAKKLDPSTGTIILTNECKLQLLRRKLLKVNLATAEQQLIRLEVSHHALEKDLEKNKQLLLFTVSQQQSQQARTPHDVSVDESNDTLLPLEQELEGVNVVKEILSRDLAKDLIPDDDTVSEMEYDEAELLQELQTLSSLDEQEDDGTSSLSGKIQTKRSTMKKMNHPRPVVMETVNHRRQSRTEPAPSSKAKKPSPKSHNKKPASSFKATLF